MAIDRSKYKQANVADVQSEAQEVNAQVFNNEGKRNWLSIETGNNKLRIYPAHPASIKPLFMLPKVTHWLPQEVWVLSTNNKKEIYTPTDEQIQKGEVVKVVKNKPIFNSKVHGNTPKDIVDEYVKFANAYFTEEIKNKVDLDKKLFPINDWQKGIKAKTAWVMYVNKIKIDGSKEFGIIEVPSSVQDGMNTISAREESEAAVNLDPFTNPESGRTISVFYNKEEKDNKKKYKVTLLWEKEVPLTDDELENFEKQKSLEELYKNSYKRSDFKKAVDGLELIDAQYKFGIFQHDSFLEILEEVDKYYPEEVEGESEETEEGTTPSPVQEEQVLETKNPLAIFSTKEELLDFITELGINLSPRSTHNYERVKTDILEIFDEEKANVEEKLAQYWEKKKQVNSSKDEIPFTPDASESKKDEKMSVGDKASKLKDKYKKK